MNNIKRLCACGCGLELMGNDPSRIYRRGHSPKPHKNKCITDGCNNFADGRSKYCKECLVKLKPKPRLCACGCGGIVTSTLREVKFLPGHNASTQECKDKARKTCNERYGGNGPMASKVIQEKSKKTCIEKYGEDNVFKCESIKTKIKDYYLTNYNVANPSQVESIHQKQTESIIKTKRIDTYRKLHDNFHKVQLLSSFDDFLKYESGEIDTLTWRCQKCNSVFTSRRDSNWLGGECRCYTCYPYIPSKYQKEIFEFVFSLDNTATQNRRDIISPQELDVFIPTKNIAIEFDGLFWHSYQQILDKSYHKNKTEKCESMNIQLIHIFEDEWIQKEEIVKSRIRNLLGIYDKTIFARKCQLVSNVSKKDCDDFLIENHIQGICNSKYRYGLYYNNELVSLMTFGNYRKLVGKENKDNEYELLRFCNKLGYHIPGAASKLFKHFVNDIKPLKVISYADRRWSIGKLYEALGFQFIHNTECNYWYVINDHREHRFIWRKSELSQKLNKFNISLTEYENMLMNGYDCIYDCGSKLYEWVN